MSDYPIVTFESDSNIAKLQAGLALQAVSAKVEMHKVDSSERIEIAEKKLEARRDFYMFASVIFAVTCIFAWMNSENFLVVIQEQRQSKISQLKAKKAILEKELAEMGEK